MALSSLALMGDMELLGRSKRKGGKVFAAIATGGASLIAARAVKKARAKQQKRVAAQVQRQVAALAPVAPAAAPVEEVPVAAPVAEVPVVETPVVETPVEEPVVDEVQSPEPPEEPMSGSYAADAANAIEMLGKNAKKRKKAGHTFAAIATGGLSAIGAKKRQKKASAKLAKQTAGMTPAQKSVFLKTKKTSIHKRIGRKFAAIATGGLSTVGRRAAVRKASAHPTGKVAMRHPGLVKASGTKLPGGPIANIGARQRASANAAFPAAAPKTAVAVIPFSPVRASGLARTAFPASSSPAAFQPAGAVRHMSIVEWSRYLFQPKYAQDYLSA
jgi:hypothetical protein